MLLSLRILQNCCTIQLTGGQNTLIDSNNFEEFSKYQWKCDQDGYVMRTTKSWPMHRSVLGEVKGRLVKIKTDHKDTDKLNNCRDNLRYATNQQNAQNKGKYLLKGKPTSSRYKGVSFHRKSKKWQASIKVNYVTHHLGSFDNEVDAAYAYNDAAIKYFGKFARINKIDNLSGPCKTLPASEHISKEDRALVNFARKLLKEQE